MTLADVSVLLAALRQDHVEHKRCLGWLTREANGSEPFGVSPQVLSSVIRISTNRRIFPETTKLDDALAFSSTLLAAPNAISAAPTERHWSIFHDLARAVGATGKLVPDAWFAALAIEWGCTWVTLDRDFARFPGLRVASP